MLLHSWRLISKIFRKHVLPLTAPTDIVIQIAGMDPLRDEGIAYADALEAVGVIVKRDIYPGIPHGFTLFPTLPASDLALKRAAEGIPWLLSDST